MLPCVSVIALVDRLSAQNRVFTSDHDANISFGIEALYVDKKVFIERHKPNLTFYLSYSRFFKWPPKRRNITTIKQYWSDHFIKKNFSNSDWQITTLIMISKN